MPIISLILVLLFIGFLIYLIQSAPIPVHPWIKTVIMGIIFFAALVYVLNALGVHTGMPVRLR
jgi:hypothetical protein